MMSEGELGQGLNDLAPPNLMELLQTQTHTHSLTPEGTFHALLAPKLWSYVN